MVLYIFFLCLVKFMYPGMLLVREKSNKKTWIINLPQIYETTLLIIIRSYLLMNIPEEGENKLTEAKLQGYAAVLSIGSTRCKANLLGSLYRVLFSFSFFLITGSFHLQTFLVHVLLSNAIVFDYAGHSIMQNLPTAVQTVCDTWNSIHTNEFPNIGSWVCTSVGYVQFQFGQLHCMMLKWFFFSRCVCYQEFLDCEVLNYKSLFVFFPHLAKCICQWYYSIWELHQCHSSRSPWNVELSGSASGLFPETHPALFGSSLRGSHCVSACFIIFQECSE